LSLVKLALLIGRDKAIFTTCVGFLVGGSVFTDGVGGGGGGGTIAGGGVTGGRQDCPDISPTDDALTEMVTLLTPRRMASSVAVLGTNAAC